MPATSSCSGVAIHHRPRAAGVSRDHFPAGRARRRLGGTEALLTEGGMQWAYSELFQNYTGREVAWYLDYSLRQCERVGLYVHYSETHDNDRLTVQRAPATRPKRAENRPRLVAAAQPALRPHQRGAALASPAASNGSPRKKSRFTAAAAWRGCQRQPPARTRPAQPAAQRTPVFFDGARLTRISPRTRRSSRCCANPPKAAITSSCSSTRTPRIPIRSRYTRPI